MECLKNVAEFRKAAELLTAVSRNCWFLFLRVHEKRLSLTENNPFAGIATDEKRRNVVRNCTPRNLINSLQNIPGKD